MRHSWKTAVGLVVTAVFLYLAFRGVDLAGVGKAISKANPWFLAAGVFVFLSSFAARAFRWKLLLAPAGYVHPWTSYQVLQIAWMANNILPARLGELVRAQVLGARTGLSRSTAFASVLAERVLDGLVLTSLFLYGSHVYREVILRSVTLEGVPAWAPTWVAWSAWVVGGLFLGALLFAVAALSFRGRLERWAETVTSHLPMGGGKVSHLVTGFLNGLEALRNPRLALPCLALSVLVWVLEGGMVYAFLHAFGVQVSPLGAGFVLALLNVGIMIPSSPGYVGPYQYFASLAVLLLCLADRPLALAFAISLHACQYIPETALGLFFLWRSGWDLGSIRNVAKPPA